MKSRLVKMFGLAYLLAATNLATISCSSSEEEGTGEEVAAEGENLENGENTENMENMENGENLGNNAEEGNFENGENFGENNANNMNNELANNELGNNAAGNEFGNEGNNAMGAETNLAANGGDENLQQIIEEMNQTNGAAPANEAVAENTAGGFDNLAANTAPVDNAAVAPPVDAGAAPAAAPAAPAAPGLPELGSKMAYIVQKGDTLAKIAQRVYGDMNKWTEIADFTGIANPKLIYPGDVVYYQLTEQSTAFANAYEAVQRTEVEVAQGDTLATISSRVFGNSSLWKLIWRQNDKIDDPDRLTAGTKIYYIDQSAMAALDQGLKATLAAKKAESSKKFNKVASAKKNSNKTVSKQVKKVVKVANDSTIDSFTSVNSQNLMNRLI